MAGECTYSGTYNSPENWFGVCAANPTVPVGCPVFFVSASDAVTSEIKAEVLRGTTGIELASTTTLVDHVTAPIATVDVFTCTCEHITAGTDVFRYQMTIPDAKVGDVVGFQLGGVQGGGSPLGSRGNAEHATVGIGDAGPCPAPEWPVTFVQNTACDLCPGTPGSPGAGSGGGCAASPANAGALAVAIALVVLAGRTRARR